MLRDLRATDRPALQCILAATDAFTAAEVAVAMELLEIVTNQPEQRDYAVAVAEVLGNVAGYVLFGPVPATDGNFDLYWIAVDPARQRHGLGSRLLAETEARAAALGCRRLYVDTSGRADYAPARAFYERHGYRRAATLEDFYAPGDPKLIYCKAFPPTAARRRAEGQKA
jgi:ribosomal protein S18 acetylase RimI-like enzyme